MYILYIHTVLYICWDPDYFIAIRYCMALWSIWIVSTLADHFLGDIVHPLRLNKRHKRPAEFSYSYLNIVNIGSYHSF